MVFNTTFNTISVILGRSVLLVEEKHPNHYTTDTVPMILEKNRQLHLPSTSEHIDPHVLYS
jgi:hypothetical protein